MQYTALSAAPFSLTLSCILSQNAIIHTASTAVRHVETAQMEHRVYLTRECVLTAVLLGISYPTAMKVRNRFPLYGNYVFQDKKILVF